MDPINEREIDIRHYYRIIKKRRWTVISFFMITVLLVAMSTLTATPVYEATTRILIERENPNLLSIQEVLAVDTTGSDFYQTQYKILESRTLAREVIKRLDLKNSEEFFPKDKNDIKSHIKKWIGTNIEKAKDWISAILRTDQKGVHVKKEIDGVKKEDSHIISTLLARIHVKPIKNSRLVDVSVEAKDPKLASDIANMVARVYIDQNMEMKLLAAKDAVKWLTDRIEEERTKVEDAENSLLKYKQDNEIITDFSSDSENITAEKLAKLNSQVIEAEALRVEAGTRYQQAIALEKNPSMLDSIPEVMNNPLIQDIKKMEVKLHNKMSELSQKYGKRHPQMIALQSELKELSERKKAETKRIIKAIKNEYELAIAKEKSLKAALDRQKGESLDMNKKAIRYGVLKRQAESSKHMYDLLIKRFKETSLTGEMKTGNIRVVDKAEIPSIPIKPKKKRNLLLAVIGGLTLGIGMVFLLEYLDNTIKSPEDIKDTLMIPYLGPVPQFDTNEKTPGTLAELITAHSPKSTASESFRGIRTGILFSSADKPPDVVLVTSAEPSEGKTICATNLAVTMAQSGSKVVVIDCDMRRPKVHEVFKIKREKGVSNILIGANSPEETIIKTDIDNLDVIPCGPIPPNPSEILGSKKMLSLIESLKKTYSKIIIDSPPITAVTDSVVLAQIADGIVLIVRSGVVPKTVVQNAVDQLKAVNVHILGGVLNAVDTGKDSYYYYNQYYYYYYGKNVHNGRRVKKTA